MSCGEDGRPAKPKGLDSLRNNTNIDVYGGLKSKGTYAVATRLPDYIYKYTCKRIIGRLFIGHVVPFKAEEGE